MKHIFISIVLFLSFSVLGNCQKNIDARLLLGLRLHNNPGQYLLQKTPLIRSSPIVGFELFSKKIPLILSYQLDGYLEPGKREVVGVILDEMIIGHFLNVYWNRDKYKIGIGYYRKRVENPLDLAFGGVRKYDGASFSFSIPFDGFDFEYRINSHIKPHFSIRGIGHQNLAILYRLNKEKIKKSKKGDFNLLLGSRFYSNKNVTLLENEVISAVGLAPTLGLEFLYKPMNISINLERDWLVALNAGSLNRDFKQYLSSSFLGVKYHYQHKNRKETNIGLGASFIRDFDLLKFGTTNLSRKGQFVYFQVKGIGTALSYELFKNTFIEGRYVFPIRALKKEGRLPNLSLGLIYKYNRLNN